MKYIKLTLSLLLIVFLATGSIAQDNKAISHTHPEYEKKLEEIKESTDKANKTFDMAQETYKAMDSREKTFFTTLQILIAILALFGLGTYFYNNHISNKAKDEAIKRAEDEVKEIKNEVLKIQSKKIKKIFEANEKTVVEMIASKERDYYLRENSKIIVINHQDTPISEGFKKALCLFSKFDIKDNMKNFVKLSDALADKNIAEFKNADLVIIENQDTKMQWKIGGNAIPSNELIMEISKAGSETPDDINNEHQNQAIMISLINQICGQTALVYYGPGVLQSTKADPDKQHLIAFANSPSTLYSNVMNLLKFKDTLENQKLNL